MVAGVGTILIDPDGGHMATYLASLERLRALGPGTLLPAHGPTIADGPGKLTEYLAHRRMREARVRAALVDDVRTSHEICVVAYADTPQWLWPVAERSVLAHRAKLVEDGDAAELEGGWRRVP
jgi:glyoxylase-like metal-dependent hydrolase (beta-lactamase superfamily II)